ncbi:MAG: SCP2 sterol-binding domain-containing protein [Deltaproteobacteria bacterium]|nr:SCP2 sterol-binding domain-containing protein [Deltaproteobacteria bacterium]MCB9785962.1 SCP2 sterol-binding domain-containing protein [Deltaproteobacteria bacterium]
MASAKDVFSDIEKRITADPAKTKSEIDGIFKFVVTGDDGGTWLVDCKDVAVKNEDGDSDVTITVAGSDLAEIHAGTLDPMQAFMMGKVVVEGDMGLAMKLQQVL